MKRKGTLILNAAILAMLFCAAGCDFGTGTGNGGEPVNTGKELYIRGTIMPYVAGVLQNKVYLKAYSTSIPIDEYLLGETVVYNPDGAYKNGTVHLSGVHAGMPTGGYSNTGTTDGQFEIQIPKGRIGQTHTLIWFFVETVVWNDKAKKLGPVNVSLYPNDVNGLDLGTVDMGGELVQLAVDSITVGGIVPPRLRVQLLWEHSDNSKTFLSYFSFSDPDQDGEVFVLPIGGGYVPSADQIELTIAPPMGLSVVEWGTPVVFPLGPWSGIKGNTILIPSFDIPAP
jgi:hypothetical protein